MPNTVYFLDHENQSKADLTALPDDASIVLFLGVTSSIDRPLFKASLRLGAGRVSVVEIEGTGKNALDFHLAFHLGEILAQAPKTRCVIVSKDKGFAPLVQYLRRRGFGVERRDTLTAQVSGIGEPSSVDDVLYDKAVASLCKGNKQARPRKRATLEKHLKNILNGKCDEGRLMNVVGRLFASGVVKESDGALTYTD